MINCGANEQIIIIIHLLSWVLVAHICNPSYSGGRDQEDHSSKLDPI
jgi:hypothetical protein